MSFSILQGDTPRRQAKDNVSNVSISISLPPCAHRKLAAMARKRGYTATKFAQLLFEAAYAARIGIERNAPVGDADLDEQVRLVFALAGQAETAAIERVTGVPGHRVERIIDGLKRHHRRQRGGRVSALTKKQGKVFLAIADQVGADEIALTHRELIRLTGTAPNTVVKTIDRILQLNLVTYRIGQRGGWVYRLTDKGRKLAEMLRC